MKFPQFPLLSFYTVLLVGPLQSAVSLPAGAQTAAETAENPAKEAMAAFDKGLHVKAVELAKPLVEKGNADALHLMGVAHENGQGAEKSSEKALEFYRKASAAGHKQATYRMSFILLASKEEAERDQAREVLVKASKDDPKVACSILAEAYLRGLLSKDQKPDFVQTISWWTQAADAGDINALVLLGRLHEGNFGYDKKDPKKALDYYAKAAGLEAATTEAAPGAEGKKPATAMVAYASRLLNSETKELRDEAKGREWAKKAIERKEYSAYLVLGDFEENVKKNPKAAFEAYDRGRDAGQVDCMLRTADAYANGKGTEKDPERGFDVLESAAKLGSPAAHYRLAAKYLTGDKPDIIPAYGHLLVAASSGLTDAQFDLANLYISGQLMGTKGPQQDPIAAVAWLDRAARAGHANAQFALGNIFVEGKAVPQNIGSAGKLYELASSQGHPEATLALSRLLTLKLGETEPRLNLAWAFATLAAEREAKGAKELATEIHGKLDEKQRTQALKDLENIKAGKPVDDADDKPKADAPKPDAPKPNTPKPAAGAR